MESLNQLQPGQMLGSYRIVRKIGQGGMGEVYEAWDAVHHRHIAIKILKSESLSDPDMTERFRNEGRALARLKQVNVVSLYTLGEFQGRIFMAMEYIDGVPLDHFMMSHACGLADIISLVRQTAEGLAAAHQAGVIHRDLKPANVVIDRFMRAKLVDFGIARVHSERATSAQTSRDVVIGTVNYLAPEVTVGRPATEQSDIYSLGLVFYHMLTGSIPFIGRSSFETLEKIRTTALAFSPRMHMLIPEEIKRIVMKMTNKAPAMRYANVGEVLADLDKVNFSTISVDLRQSVASGFPVANYLEVRKRCESLGFDSGEARFILAIAAGLEVVPTPKPAEEDATEKIDIRPLIEISELNLGEAVRRFRQAKSAMISRRQAEQQFQLAARQQPTRDLAQTFLTLICAVLIFGGAFYFYMAAVNWRRAGIQQARQMLSYLKGVAAPNPPQVGQPSPPARLPSGKEVLPAPPVPQPAPGTN